MVSQAIQKQTPLSLVRQERTAILTLGGVVWGVFLVKGTDLPVDEELRETIIRLHEQNISVPFEWRLMTICPSYGEAITAQGFISDMPGAHENDHIQIAPFTLNEIVSFERYHLPDVSLAPPIGEFIVVRRDEYEILQQIVRELHGN